MGRKTRMRLVKQTPNNFYFQPLKDEDAIILTIAEFEAMRLKHYINLNQKDAAEKIGVSQPTFSRILENGHRRMTQALIEGKSIRIFGGNVNYKKGFNGYGCLACNNEWEDESASKDEKGVKCPKCESTEVYHLIKEPL